MYIGNDIEDFLIVKTINAISDKNYGKNYKIEKAAPTTKKCAYSKTKIDIDALRCPNCTSK